MKRAAVLIILCVLGASLCACKPREEQVLIMDRWWTWRVTHKYTEERYGYCWGRHDGEWSYDWGLCEYTETRYDVSNMDRELPVRRPMIGPPQPGDWEEESLDYQVLCARLSDDTRFTATINAEDWEYFPPGSERQILVSILSHVVAWTDDFQRKD